MAIVIFFFVHPQAEAAAPQSFEVTSIKLSSEDGRKGMGEIAPGGRYAVQEQLGLKLKSEKGPVEIIVIDQIDRPSPN